MRAFLLRSAAAVASCFVACTSAFAQVPALSSRPGAAYTVYLNFEGFAFTGVWGGTFALNPPTPGVSLAYGGSSAQMQEIWSRTAEKYAVFNVNVTTVDPAVAAGQAGSDFARQAFYDSQPRVMQTVVGGDGAWYGAAGGVSYGGVTATPFSPVGQNGGAGAGVHTNFIFADNLGGGLPQFVAEATVHENGHGLGLRHQALWTGVGGSLINAYDPGDGNRAPVMGNSYTSARGLWRVGATSVNSSNTAQNDVHTIQQNAGMMLGTATGFVDSGIGHTTGTATPLPLTGTVIDSAVAAGVITPITSTNPNPLGSANYTKDVYSFSVAPGTTANVNVSLLSGRSTIVAGVADPGGTLDATFKLLDAGGATLFTSDTGTFTESIVQSGLAPGQYYFEVSSAGAHSQYFDMGSYFLAGTITPVPEPTAVLVVAAGGWVGVRVLRRRRTSAEVAVSA